MLGDINGCNGIYSVPISSWQVYARVNIPSMEHSVFSEKKQFYKIQGNCLYLFWNKDKFIFCRNQVNII